MTRRYIPRLSGGAPLSLSQYNANYGELMHWSGLWDAGTVYEPEEFVFWEGGMWRCVTTTSAGSEPQTQNADWSLISPNPGLGSGILTTTTPISIGAPWVVIPIDAEGHESYNVVFDFGANTFQLLSPGIWQVNVFLNIGHNEANQSRGFSVRAWNVSDGSQFGRVVRIYVGRNIYGTSQGFSFRMPIGYGDEGDVFRFELGDADGSFSATEMRNVRFDIAQLTPRVYFVGP